MSNVKDRREVARLTVRGREFWIERIVWKDSTGLSFDVYDADTDQCLTAESFDNQPGEAEVAALLDQLKDDLGGGTLDRFFDDDETKATLTEILASDDNGARYYVTSLDGSLTFAGPFDDQAAADEAAEQVEQERPGAVTDIRYEIR